MASTINAAYDPENISAAYNQQSVEIVWTTFFTVLAQVGPTQICPLTTLDKTAPSATLMLLRAAVAKASCQRITVTAQ